MIDEPTNFIEPDFFDTEAFEGLYKVFHDPECTIVISEANDFIESSGLEVEHLVMDRIKTDVGDIYQIRVFFHQ